MSDKRNRREEGDDEEIDEMSSRKRRREERRKKREAGIESQWDLQPLQDTSGFSGPNTQVVPMLTPVTAPGGYIPGASLANPTPAMPVMSSHQDRQARRIYVGNLPPGISDRDLRELLNAVLKANHPELPGEPCTDIISNPHKLYAFAEFRTAEEATMCMMLGDVPCRGHVLRLNRPKDYVPGPADVAMIEAANPYKVYVGGLPPQLSEMEVRELLSSFGKIRSFNLVRDTTTQQLKGYGFVEYEDDSNADKCIKGLNGESVGGKVLQVQYASANSNKPHPLAITAPLGPQQNVLPGAPITPDIYPGHFLNSSIPLASIMSGVKGPRSGIDDSSGATRILVLFNCVDPSELENERLYEDIMADIREEAIKYGNVLSIQMPHEIFDPHNTINEAHNPPPAGLGKVFIEYQAVDEARKACGSLSGRKFDGRTIITSYYSEEAWARGDLSCYGSVTSESGSSGSDTPAIEAPKEENVD